MKILVADDEEKIVEQLKKYLEKNKYSVDTALDGERALKLIKENNYDIVFLDDNMPWLTGLEIVEYIKKNKLNPKTVILTGYPYIDEKFSKYVGADEYLDKPVDLKKINEIIKKYLV
jgi:DNA-binding response OmpR family regulator